MSDEQGGGYYVDTASGPVYIPDDVPSWVVDSLIDQAGGMVDPVIVPPPASGEPPAPGSSTSGGDASSTQPPAGEWIPGPNGPVWIPEGVPDWVVALILEQQGTGPAAQTGPSLGALPPPVTPQPPGPGVVPGQGPSSMPVPVPLPPPPVGPLPPSSPGGGGLSGAWNTIKETAEQILSRARQYIEPAAGFIGSTVEGILGAARDVASYLAPTISELALGLTSRFGDLASFIGGNLASVGELADNLANGMASGMSLVLDDAWAWMLRSLLGFFRLLARPVQALLEPMMRGAVMGEL